MRSVNHEDLVLRSNYMSKMTDKNVDAKLREYKEIILITTRISCHNMSQTMERIGYDFDDVHSLANLYSHYFFNIYADKVIKKTPRDERNALITFIKQRLWYLFKVGDKQAKNFHVNNWVGGYFAKTPKSIDIDEEMGNTNPEYYGYRKVSVKEYQVAQKNRVGGRVLDKFGFEIIRMGFVEKVSEIEYACLLHDGVDLTASVEEQAVERCYIEEKEELEEKLAEFLDKPEKEQVKFLEKYINNTKNKEKILAARKLKRIVNRRIKCSNC